MEDKKTNFTKEELIKIFKENIVAELDAKSDNTKRQYSISDTDADVLLDFTQDVFESISQVLKTFPIHTSTEKNVDDTSPDDYSGILEKKMEEVSKSYVDNLIGEKSYFVNILGDQIIEKTKKFKEKYSKIKDKKQEANTLAESIKNAKAVLDEYKEYVNDPIMDDVLKTLQKQINKAVETLNSFYKEYCFAKTATTSEIKGPQFLKQANNLEKATEAVIKETKQAREKEIRPFVDAIDDRLNSVKREEYSYSSKSTYCSVQSVQSGLEFKECKYSDSDCENSNSDKSFDFDKCAVVTLSELINAINDVDSKELLVLLKTNQIVSEMATKVLIVDDGYDFLDTSIITCLQKRVFNGIFVSESTKNKIENTIKTINKSQNAN